MTFSGTSRRGTAEDRRLAGLFPVGILTLAIRSMVFSCIPTTRLTVVPEHPPHSRWGVPSDVFEINPAVRLVLVTGGPGAGKTVLCKRLYSRLPKHWRFVPLDNFIGLSFRLQEPGDWPNKTVKLGEVCLDYWRKEKLYSLLVEGVIQNEDQVVRLCTAFGTHWPAPEVRLIQLTRTFATHKSRRESESEWSPPMTPGMTRDDAFRNLEARVPGLIEGARVIATDRLSEEEVLEATFLHLA